MFSPLHRLNIPMALATATLFLCLPAAAADPAAVVERQLAAMGTLLQVQVAAPTRAAAVAASEAAVRAVEAAELRLSTWRHDTELATLNRHPVGSAFPLSPQLAAELGTALKVWHLTGGAFDPGIGLLVSAWDLRGAGRRPTIRELQAARAASGLRHLHLTGPMAFRRHAGLRLEEGGFGKGAALDAALAALRGTEATAAVLDLGGQVATLGGTAGVEVLLAHPEDRTRPVAALRLWAGSLSTSGNGQRRREGRGPHLLDPRTGYPARDFGSLTVWAASALEADALSTGLYVLGPKAALAWAERHPQYGVIVVELVGGQPRLRLSRDLAASRLPLQLDILR